MNERSTSIRKGNYMIDNGDKCLKCGQDSMPKVSEESKATARACSDPRCMFVELLTRKDEPNITRMIKIK